MEIAYNYLNLPAEVRFVEEKITYIYNAAGEKVSKIVEDQRAGTTTTTLYQDGFQYINDELRFFPTTEGYVNVIQDRFNYVYNYTDHLGNIRLSFLKDPENGTIGILEENNYYPFGLKHENYNAQKLKLERSDDGVSIVLRPTVRNIYQYKYQGQERQDELGLNWDSFKYRNYDYAIGRFMSIDPLAENYTYNSPYAFQENKLGMGIELEGLELHNNRGNEVGRKDGDEIKQLATSVYNTVTGLFSSDKRDRRASMQTLANNMPGLKAVETYDKFRRGGDVSASEAITAIADFASFAAVIVGVAGGTTATAGATTTTESTAAATAESVESGYSGLVDSKSVGPGKPFTQQQKANIIRENMKKNGGVIKSDMSGTVLDKAVQSKKGVKANMNQAEIDHMTPKSKGGSNSYGNAQVLSKTENLKKRDK